MKQVLIKKGKAIVEDIPAPMVSPGRVLVKVAYSCISAGTEMASIKSSGQTIIQRALREPQNIKKGLNLIKEKGILKTKNILQSTFESGSPTGYSTAGTVVEVGAQVRNIKVGDRVACAGAGYANHAECIEVPRNLLVKIPQDLDFKEASTVTLGSIAMQGVRRAEVKLGENIAVIGMGILGQLASQMVTAGGARVIAIDLDDRRLTIAQKNGAKYILNPTKENIVEEAIKLTEGYGMDSVIITAATSSNEPLAQAFQMCRKKGRVILVGVVGMEINREDMYKKELDFYISSSYGPGRYDPNYEEKGIDYPYPYVRWTENRNMQEYLKMLSEDKIKLANIIEKVYEIEEVTKAYQEFEKEENRPLIVLLKYKQEELEDKIDRRVEANPQFNLKTNKIKVAIVGAGSFAQGTHLPNLEKLNNFYDIYAIMSRTGSNATSIARQYKAKYATTNYQGILDDPNVNLVMICIRHNLHAQYSIEAMKKGKAVFVEKPMALNEREMEEIFTTIQKTGMPYLVGFNRRFSKYAIEIKKHIKDRINPMIINYQMNAGYIPLDHWVHTEEGGGRIIGEACHIFDLFNYFVDAEIATISVNSINPKTKNISSRDNVVVTLKYKEGSICTLTYTALGDKTYPKESLEIYFDNKIITMKDYKALEGYGVKIANINSKLSDKGHYEELIAFSQVIKDGTKYPIPLWQIEQATKISFAVEEEIKK
ncbi:MAG TPA: oxidoreductase [Candidatus Atribacteria bacterium]|uniref:Oxidoreductase, NAD-binding domain protein n=1 Tax=candidate division TA06 bacterium 34_109 TaxID=1635277 RepID=A0A117M5Y6_UNCT6|nr:MAG: Oxidoreductase, NAD-binding domain protein [candidate division TA06 bacterium 34_109]HBY58144.1 oxidoreductase [Candidatus Atribacteria bacterium]